MNTCVPPNSHVGILTPVCLVLGGGAFEKCLGHEDGALMDRISALLKEARTELPGPFCYVRTR